MNTGFELITSEYSDYKGYKIEVFGPMSRYNGGPWAAKVYGIGGLLVDAIYGNKNQHEAHQKALASVKEELSKGRHIDRNV
jgi:hypothetical protein